MSVRLERAYGSPDLAERVARAVAVDDPDALTIRTEADRIRIVVVGTQPASLRRTLDDLIACLGAAERTAGLVRPARR